MQLALRRISIKWRIFVWCFALALAIVGFNAWYATRLVHKSAGRITNELQGHFDRAESELFQNVRNLFGGRIRQCVTGAAPIFDPAPYRPGRFSESVWGKVADF